MTINFPLSRQVVLIIAIGLGVVATLLFVFATYDLYLLFPAKPAELPPDYKSQSDILIKLLVDGSELDEETAFTRPPAHPLKVAASLRLDKDDWRFVPGLEDSSPESTKHARDTRELAIPMFEVAFLRKSTLAPGYVADQVRASSVKVQRGHSETTFTVDTPMREGTYLLLFSLKQRFVPSDEPSSLKCYLACGQIEIKSTADEVHTSP